MQKIIQTFSIALLLFLVKPTYASTIEIKVLSKTDRVNLVEAYKEFLLNLENIHQDKEQKLYSTIIFEKIINNFVAYADASSDCLYAGWPSRRASNGFCNRPETVKEYNDYLSAVAVLEKKGKIPPGFDKCGQDERLCNPTIFGPVCAPFDTKYNRVRATSNCNKASLRSFPNGFDYQTYFDESDSDQKVVLNLLDKNFEGVQKTASSVCNDPNKKQAKTAVCSILASRLQENFPYHPAVSGRGPGSGNGFNNTNSPIKAETTEDLEKIENEVGELNLKINEVLGSDFCTDPSVAKVVDERYNTIQLMDPKTGEFLTDEGSDCVKKLKPLFDRRKALLEAYEKGVNAQELAGGMCPVNGEDVNSNALAEQITEINSIVAENACNKNPKKWTAKGCAGDFACAIGSSLFYGSVLNKVGAYVGKKLGFKEDCLNGKNNCLAKIATAAADVVWSFLKSIPDLLSMVGDGIVKLGKKIYSWMPWVTETEKKMNVANQSMANVAGEDEESTLEKIGNFFTGMFDMMKDYITKDLMCTEPGWELERFKDDAHCDQPFVSWNCLSCAGAISTVCNVVGVVGSELLIGILTGGTATAAKAGVRALSAGVKGATRMMLKSQMKGIAKLGKVSVKLGQVAGTPLRLSRRGLQNSKVFLQNQKARYVKTQAWVNRNVNRIATPLRPKNQLVKNVAELTVEGTKRTLKNTGKLAGGAVKGTLKLPKRLLQFTGWVLDPLSLGRKGFAIGYNAAHGLIPMIRLQRIGHFGDSIASSMAKLNSTESAARSVDVVSDLMRKSNAQMDEWIKAAQKGKLTQAEFNQLQELIKINQQVAIKFSGKANSIKRLTNVTKQFDERTKQLLKIMGEDEVKRYMTYIDDVYRKANINDASLVAKESPDVIMKSGGQSIYIVDHVDGNLVGLNEAGKKVIVSTGSLSRSDMNFVLDKLGKKSTVTKLSELNGLKKKQVTDKIAKHATAKDYTKPTLVQKYQDKLKNKANAVAGSVKKKTITPLQIKLDRRQLRNYGKKNRVPAEKAIVEEKLDRFANSMITRASKAKKAKNIDALAKDMEILRDLRKSLPDESKYLVDNYRREIYKSFEDPKLRNQLSNRMRKPVKEGTYQQKRDNISLYSNKGRNNTFNKSFDAKVSSYVDDSGVYVRLDKNNTNDFVRVYDQSEKSIIGFNQNGDKVMIKKSSLKKSERKAIEKELNSISPYQKRKMEKWPVEQKKIATVPERNPDFNYEKPLRKNQIRVGDEIVKIRRWQAGTQPLVESITNTGQVIIKNKKGIPIKINNVQKHGDYWIGLTADKGEKVLIPNFLLDAKSNSLMAKSYNLTKLKRDVGKKLSFIKGFNRKTKKIDVDKAFRKKYKYANFFIKYNMGQRAIADYEPTQLEKIAENLYIRSVNETNAEIFYTSPDDEMTLEEQQLIDEQLMNSVDNETEDFDFDNLDDSDFMFE